MIHGDDEILIACSFWWGVLIVSFWWGNCCSCKSFAKVGLLELCPALFFFLCSAPVRQNCQKQAVVDDRLHEKSCPSQRLTSSLCCRNERPFEMQILQEMRWRVQLDSLDNREVLGQCGEMIVQKSHVETVQV